MLYPPNSTPPPPKKYSLHFPSHLRHLWNLIFVSATQSDVWLSAVLTVILRDAVVTPGLKGQSEILRCICRCIFKQVIQSHYREGRSFPPVLPPPHRSHVSQKPKRGLQSREAKSAWISQILSVKGRHCRFVQNLIWTLLRVTRFCFSWLWGDLNQIISCCHLTQRGTAEWGGMQIERMCKI